MDKSAVKHPASKPKSTGLKGMVHEAVGLFRHSCHCMVAMQ